MTIILWFQCAALLFVLVWNDRRYSKKLRNVMRQRDKAQSRFEEANANFEQTDVWLSETQGFLQKTNDRAEGYSSILIRLFDGLRKASDEYEKVRRGRK